MSDSPVRLDEDTSRRLKKREHDRRAQRALRERTKNRIAQLEAQVEVLTQQGTDAQTSMLLQQIADLTKERDTLAELLTHIGTTVEKYTGRQGTASSRMKDVAKESTTSALATDLTLGQMIPYPNKLSTSTEGTVCESLAVSTELECDVLWGDNTSPANLGPQDQPHSHPSSLHPAPEMSGESTAPMSAIAVHEYTVAPQPGGACECTSLVPLPETSGNPGNFWRIANSLLGIPSKFSNEVLEFEDMISEDLAVRAILEGWDAVDTSIQLSPLWTRLRSIDQIQFYRLPRTERLAIMIAMHQFLRYQAHPSEEQKTKLFSFLQPRPCQAMIRHSSATDYFVWPGLRERFLFTEHRYCANFFWFHFTNNFHITWPFEFRDCYKRNPANGKLSVSADFRDCISKLRSWTMTPDFFKAFPELIADIPASNTIPATLHDKRETEVRSFVRSLEPRSLQQICPANAIACSPYSRTDRTTPEDNTCDETSLATFMTSIHPAYNYLSA